jgi:hypothetical protein
MNDELQSRAERWAQSAVESWEPAREESAEIIRALLADRDALKADAERKQACIDALMLEFCPSEMTEEQCYVWARNQVAARKQEPSHD